MLNNLPSGTITFLFTDIEGSTQLWERYPDAMQAALAWHDELLRRAIESHHGRVVKSTGDGCLAAFASAAEAVAAIIDIQRALQAGSGPPTPDHDGAPAGVEPSSAAGPVIRIRAGLHTGQAERRDDDYYGTALNRAARIMSVGHGGQVLLSAATAALISDSRPVGVSLRDLGEHRLRDLSRPNTSSSWRPRGCRSFSRRSNRSTPSPATCPSSSPLSWAASASWPKSSAC